MSDLLNAAIRVIENWDTDTSKVKALDVSIENLRAAVKRTEILEVDMTKYIEQCLEGVIDPDEIDKFIEKWHSVDCGVSLPDYLGLSNEEYAKFVEDPESIHSIIMKRKI